MTNDVWLKHRAHRQGAWGEVVYTNTNTLGTYTQQFALRGKRHVVRDNGDGTIIIKVLAYGTSRFYDSADYPVGNVEGWSRFAYVIDRNGTPADPTDDQVVDGSFRILRTAEAHEQFCNDLGLYST